MNPAGILRNLNFLLVIVCFSFSPLNGSDYAWAESDLSSSELIASLLLPPDLLPVPAPSIPGLPPRPSLPRVPDLPEVPSLPDVPDLPDLPPLPDLPDLPTIPEAPASTVPTLPPVPVLPPPPSLPGLPSGGSSTPTPTPLPQAFITVWTEGYLTPITSGVRSLPAEANITRLEWSSIHATTCETRGYMSGGLLSGSLVAPDSQLVLAPDSSLTYAIRCQNTSRIWSTWREVTITKAPAMDTPGSSTDSAPEAPIIRGADFSTSASVGAPTGFSVPFTFRSVDADGDTLRYHIDWDNDGILDQIAPASGFVPSGTAETTNYLWLRAGTYTFAVKAEDRTRRSSSWTTHTIVISNGHSSVAPVAPQMTLTLSRYLVRTDETVTATLVVRADYPVSCILYGVTGGSYTVHYPGGVGEMTYLKDTDPLRASQIVRGVCTPEGSGVALGRETREKQVRVVPTVEEI